MNEMLDEIREIVYSIVSEEYPEVTKDIGYDVELSEYGVNSLKFVIITVLLEDKYDIEFEDEKLDMEEVWTIRKLAEYVEKCQNS